MKSKSQVFILSLSLVFVCAAICYAATVAQWLKDGHYVSANAITAAAGKIPVGNGTSYAESSMSGDATIASGGAVTVTKTNGVVFATSATTDTTNASNIASGTVGTARLGSGTANATTYLRGDQSWQALSGAPFSDNSALVKNNADNTKLGIFDVSNLTTATTRTWKMIDANGSIPIGPTAGPITFVGPTAARTVTFPDAAFTAARTDAAQTFTGHNTFEGVTPTGATGTGLMVFGTSPTFVTPALGTPASGNLANCTGLPSQAPFADNAALVKNNADNTKLGIFDVSNLTTATTRTWKMIDANGSIPIGPTAGPITFAGPTAARTWTGPDTSSTLFSAAAVTNHAVHVSAAGSAVTQIAVLASGTVFQGNAAADPTWTATPTLGVAGATTGQLNFSGSTSGTVTITPANTAGTWTMTLPASAGSSTNVLQTDGTGITSWVALGGGDFYTASLGDASDGNVTFDGSTTIAGMAPSSNIYTFTRDYYFGNVTINSGITVKSANYRMFCNGNFTNSSGTVDDTGGSASTITGGTTISTGFFQSSNNGANGNTAGSNNGSATTNTFGGSGAAGGTSGSVVHAGGNGGTAIRPTGSNGGSTLIHNGFFALIGQAAASNIIGGAPGGSGGGDGTNAGGGGGASGGVIWLCCKTFNNTGGTIKANGGNGGNAAAGNAGGGGGGGGGTIFIFCSTNSASGTIQVNGGTHGNGIGVGSANGSDGSSGSSVVYLMP